MCGTCQCQLTPNVVCAKAIFLLSALRAHDFCSVCIKRKRLVEGLHLFLLTMVKIQQGCCASLQEKAQLLYSEG